jgi:hypothetical protein
VSIEEMRQMRHLLTHDRDGGMTADGVGDRGGKALAIDGEGRTSWNAGRVGRAHDQRACAPHLLFEEADGVVQLVTAERIAADELGESIGAVNVSATHRPHFMQDDRHAA